MGDYQSNLRTCHRCGKWENRGEGNIVCTAAGQHRIDELAKTSACPLGLHADLITKHSTIQDVRVAMETGSPFSSAWQKWPNVRQAYREALEEFARIESRPEQTFSGTGIAIIGSGRFFPLAYLTLRLLRQVGCTLPVELFGPPNIWTHWQQKAVEAHGGRCVDLGAAMRQAPVRLKGGWPIKAFAFAFGCSFERLIGIEAGVFATRDPTYLLESEELATHGAIFWPDRATTLTDEDWGTVGLPPRHEHGVASHLMALDKRIAWKCLRVADWMTQRSDVLEVGHGHKSIFHLAARTAGPNYLSVPRASDCREGATMDFDPAGRGVLFVHHPKMHRLFPEICHRSTTQPDTSLRINTNDFPMLADAQHFYDELRAFHRIHAPRVHALTVCVNYGDYLTRSLPQNRDQFDSFTVVTIDGDAETLAVCKKHNVDVVITNRLHEHGASFNKGAVINDGLKRLEEKHPNDWLCILDADMLFPRNLRQVLDCEPLDRSCIYGVSRSLKSDKPISGFFQLFHGSHRRRYREDHHSAGYTDTWFRDLWSTDKQVTIDLLKATHLSKHGVNWLGRVTPRYVPPGAL